MPIIVTTPTASIKTFAIAGGTINNPITFAPSAAENIAISFSVDSGSNWIALDTVTCAAEATTYLWNVVEGESPDDHYTQIFGSANFNATMKLRFIGSTSGTAYSNVFTMYKVSFEGIIPNGSLYGSLKILSKTLINITWGDAYTEAAVTKVDILYKIGAGSWTMLAEDINNTGSYIWCPNNDDGLADSGDVLDLQLMIRDHDNPLNRLYSEGVDDGNNRGFDLTDTVPTSALPDGMMGPERFETFARTAIEKGILPDEAISVSQLEAGAGIRIRQRNVDGELSTDLGDKPYQAFNLVIEAEPAIAARRPREMQGYLNFANDGIIDTDKEAGVINYGTALSIDILHSWNLGDPTDPLFVTGQTRNSWMIQIKPIQVDGDGSGTDSSGPAEWERVYTESRTRDSLRTYFTIKGDTKLIPSLGVTPDSLIPLSKDKLDFDPHASCDFEYRLIEIIPS